MSRPEIYVGSAVIDYRNRAQRVTLDPELTEKRFAVSASIWNTTGSDITSGGQSQDRLREALEAGAFRKWAPGWGPDRLRRALDLWDRWHLNDVTPGCEHQRAGVAADEGDPHEGTPWDERPIDPEKPTDTYGTHFDGQRVASWNMLAWVRRDEHPHGLLSYPCPTCGYCYGSAWLTVEIPDDVRAEIREVFGL